jgi:hypothetical protein
VGRAVLTTLVEVGIAVLAGIAVAAALGAFRGGDFNHEFENSLWIVGAFMLLLAVFSFSPSARRGPDELITVWTGRRSGARNLDERGGLGLSLTLIVGGLILLVIARLNG